VDGNKTKQKQHEKKKQNQKRKLKFTKPNTTTTIVINDRKPKVFCTLNLIRYFKNTTTTTTMENMNTQYSNQKQAMRMRCI
jgi:hypothetical protein